MDNFTIKQLQASITINPQSSTPTFNGTDANTVTFGGPGDNAVRMRAEIYNAGGIDGHLSLAVFGLPLSVMNQLATYGQQINLLPKNQIILSAGDENGMQQVYTGSIIQSILQFNQPDCSMQIMANAAAAWAAVKSEPQSYNGTVDAAEVLSQIAQTMGLQFENNGVNVKLSNVYVYGSPRDQYRTIVEHANIQSTIERGVMSIWPKFKNREGNVVSISPSDGTMIGYPVYTQTGISVRALYNPSFAIGRQFKISGSQLPAANATWNIYGVNHLLESQTPGGAWESVLSATSPNFSTPVT